MLVYQALLLGGYAYAHWLGRVPAAACRRRSIWRCSRSRRLWLPIGLIAMQLARRCRAGACGCRGCSALSIGPLFFADLRAGAAAPALVRGGERRARSLCALCRVQSRQLRRADRLSAAGRAADWRCTAQSWLWTGGYVAGRSSLVAACALLLPRETPQPSTSSTPARRAGRAARRCTGSRWRCVPSGLMLATSTYPHHRYRRDADAVGDPARALPAQLHRRLRARSRRSRTCSPGSRR